MLVIVAVSRFTQAFIGPNWLIQVTRNLSPMLPVNVSFLCDASATMRAEVAVGAVMLPPDYGSKTCDEGRVLSGNRFGAGATSPGGLAATAAASRGDTRHAVAVDCSVGSGAWRQSGRPRTRSQLHGTKQRTCAGDLRAPVSDRLAVSSRCPWFRRRELRPGLSSWRTVGAPNSPCVLAQGESASALALAQGLWRQRR